MRRRLLCLASLWLCLAGCSQGPEEPPLPKGSPASSDAEKPVPHHGGAEPAASTEVLTEPTLVSLQDGAVQFTAPAGWRNAPVGSPILEHELSLPHAEGDEFDGRLTMMRSGGAPDELLGRWKSEFTSAGDPIVTTLTLGGVEATLVDIRGEWKGSGKPITPRPDYRLLAARIPLDANSAYFVKLTGPKATLAARNEEFTTFLKSLKLQKK